MIHLDYQATTPPAPEVVDAMRPWLVERFANPHSPSRWGREAAAAIAAAREELSRTLEGTGGTIHFTSGATEALNWAMKGTLWRSDRPGLVTVATEHAAVLDTAAWLARQGADLTVLPVDRDGLVEAGTEAAIGGDTALVACMLVNNEIGVVQDEGLGRLSRAARHNGTAVLCDAVQGFGRVRVPVADCDLVALSAHKIHGPKGIGALWVRDGFVPEPLMHGGGQEGGVRSGTLSPALCVGFGVAARLARERMVADRVHVAALRDRLLDRIGNGWCVNGSATSRWPGNLNLFRQGLDAGRLISELRELAFSAGSACASGSGRPSHVLTAIGLTDAQARSSIRLGFGRHTTIDEIDCAAALIHAGVGRQEEWA